MAKHRLLGKCIDCTLSACYRHLLKELNLCQENYPYDDYINDVKKYLKFSNKDIEKGVKETIND